MAPMKCTHVREGLIDRTDESYPENPFSHSIMSH